MTDLSEQKWHADDTARDLSPLQMAVGKLSILRENIRKWELEMKSLKRQRAELEEEIIPDLMAEGGFVDALGHGSFTTQDGSKVYLATDTYASIRKDNEEEVFDWMDENGYEDIARLTIHPQTLRAWVRERLEAGEEVPEGVSVHVTTKARMRKA